jgi:DNA polymerase IIIc chi subunit
VTTIDFYTRCANRLEVAAKLVAKAWAQHGSVRVLTADEAATVEFDRLLWAVPAWLALMKKRLNGVQPLKI